MFLQTHRLESVGKKTSMVESTLIGICEGTNNLYKKKKVQIIVGDYNIGSASQGILLKSEHPAFYLFEIDFCALCFFYPNYHSLDTVHDLHPVDPNFSLTSKQKYAKISL